MCRQVPRPRRRRARWSSSPPRCRSAPRACGGRGPPPRRSAPRTPSPAGFVRPKCLRPPPPRWRPRSESMTYTELHCHSAYSFLDGASLPEELVVRAAELGYGALALSDHDGLYGSLEFAHAAKAFGVRPITGAEITLADGSHVTLLAESATGYANLCRLLTEAHAGTRLPGREDELLPPSLEQRRLEELNDGLVCLSGC